jgi:hypothetical protein
MRTFVACLASVVLGTAIALGSHASAQVKISSLPAASSLTGSELIPAVQGGADVVLTPASLLAFVDTGVIQGTPTPGHCAAWFSATALQDSGAACGGGGGGSPGGSSGQLQYNNASAFGGFTLAGDCTIAVPTITCLKTNGASFGTFATQNYATPPAIGGTTPAAGSFTTLSASTSIADSGLGASLPVCTNGSSVLSTSGCGLSGSLAYKPANPAATAATTGSSFMGIATSTITPATTGRLMIVVTGDGFTNTAAATETIQLWGGTSAFPANAATTWTNGLALGNPVKFQQGAQGRQAPFALTWVVTGRVIGAPYGVDLSLLTSAGADTAQVENISVSIVEF